jgi:flagellar hook-associated protein 1
MRSTFHGLEIAKRSLFTQQAALNTTGHNIANANTEGFSRQVVNMTASRPLEAPGFMRSTAPGQLGMGVEFTSITRVREQFLDDQFRNENKSLGNWSVQADTLEKLESIMNEPSDTGIRTVMDNFWKSWSDLSSDPSSINSRKLVRENANALTDALNYTSKKLTDLSSDLTSSIDTKIKEANTLLTSIGNLNGEIMRIEGLGDDANDLRDQRDLLTDQLSKIVNIDVQETSQGYTISMGGNNLVTYTSAAQLNTETVNAAFSSKALNSGEIFGMITSRDKYVADYKNQLDILANSLATGEMKVTIPEGSVLPDNTKVAKLNSDGITTTEMTLTGAARTVGAGGLTVIVNGLNGLHQLGYIASDTPKAGGDFFTSFDGKAITADNIRLNPAIASDSNLIASSIRTAGSPETVVKGNNSLALLISKMKETEVSFAGSSTSGVPKGTVDDFFRALVGQLGVQSKESKRQTDNQKTLVDEVDSRRMSISGVSLDEEMSNMIKFQHAYAAASRVMTTFDQLLDKIINGMGVVGR